MEKREDLNKEMRAVEAQVGVLMEKKKEKAVKKEAKGREANRVAQHKR